MWPNLVAGIGSDFGVVGEGLGPVVANVVALSCVILKHRQPPQQAFRRSEEETYPGENLDHVGLQVNKLLHSLRQIDLSDAIVVPSAASLELKRRQGCKRQKTCCLNRDPEHLRAIYVFDTPCAARITAESTDELTLAGCLPPLGHADSHPKNPSTASAQFLTNVEGSLYPGAVSALGIKYTTSARLFQV